jgi:hypothetical protein
MRLRTYRSDAMKVHATDRRTIQSPATGIRAASVLVERIALIWTFASFVLVVVPPEARSCRASGKEMESSSLQLADGVSAGKI